MKNIFILLLLLKLVGVSAQQVHVITAYDTYFSPDTSFVNVGDTVRLVSVGYHSITELDSVDWVNNTATDNGGFWVGFGASTSDDWFVVNQAGKYYFNCNPHATLGMKGVLYVGSILDVESAIDVSKVSAYLDDKNNLHLNYNKCDEVNVYSITGEKIITKKLDRTNNYSTFSLDVNKGIYLISFMSNASTVTTKKVVVQ